MKIFTKSWGVQKYGLGLVLPFLKKRQVYYQYHEDVPKVSWISSTSWILVLYSRNWSFTYTEEMKLFMWAVWGRRNLTPLYRERMGNDISMYLSRSFSFHCTGSNLPFSLYFWMSQIKTVLLSLENIWVLEQPCNLNGSNHNGRK